MAHIYIIGAGSWGTAMATCLSSAGHTVTLWARNATFMDTLRQTRENTRYLPGVVLGDTVSLTNDLSDCTVSDIIVMAVPSHTIRGLAREIAPFVRKKQIIVSISKGFDEKTHQRLSEVITEEVPQACVLAMSGPSHAEEVARALPTTNVVAGANPASAALVQRIFTTPFFRIYTSEDIVGVELGGAIKNVIALAAGMCDGLGYGDNTRAALITRGISEMTRLGIALGAKAETFAGLSGIGDLIVTCTSMHSRNRRAGILIGQGKTVAEAEAEVHMVVEGIKAAAAVHTLSYAHGVEMPISNEVYNIVYRGHNVKESVGRLMGRSLKPEV